MSTGRMQLDGYQELVVMKNGKQLLNGYGVSFGVIKMF